MPDTTDLAQKVQVFLEASVRDWTSRAARMLATTPEIAGHSFATAVVLGDADRPRVGLDAAPRGLRLALAWLGPAQGGRPAGRGPAAAGRPCGPRGQSPRSGGWPDGAGPAPPPPH